MIAMEEPSSAAEVMARARAVAAWRRSIMGRRPSGGPAVKMAPSPSPSLGERETPLAPPPFEHGWENPFRLRVAYGGFEPEIVRGTRPSIAAAVAFVAAHLGVSVDEVRSYSRARPLIVARQLAMWLARKTTEASLPTIGRGVGGRDHTTVLHGVRRVERAIADGSEMGRTALVIEAAYLRRGCHDA